MSKKIKIFTEWARKVYGPDSYYTVTPQVLEWAAKNWEEVENTLITWGAITTGASDEEFRNALEDMVAADEWALADMLAAHDTHERSEP